MRAAVGNVVAANNAMTELRRGVHTTPIRDALRSIASTAGVSLQQWPANNRLFVAVDNQGYDCMSAVLNDMEEPTVTIVGVWTNNAMDFLMRQVREK